ncbi:hypothetical protein HDU76_003046 [Blyttiomyces sp. JEL0837]|nr:hypothetical protein HDU76_003046 [Blyttiomyces sp. JEL0837]
MINGLDALNALLGGSNGIDNENGAVSLDHALSGLGGLQKGLLMSLIVGSYHMVFGVWFVAWILHFTDEIASE